MPADSELVRSVPVRSPAAGEDVGLCSAWLRSSPRAGVPPAGARVRGAASWSLRLASSSPVTEGYLKAPALQSVSPVPYKGALWAPTRTPAKGPLFPVPHDNLSGSP